MKFKSFLLIFVIAFYVFVYLPVHCNCQTHDTNIQIDFRYQQLAFELFGNDTTFNFSPQRSYVLCSKKVDSLNMNPNFLNEFFVAKSTSGDIIYKDKISGANISWKSDYELLVVIQKGIITSTQDKGKYSFVYNIITHEKFENIESINNK